MKKFVVKGIITSSLGTGFILGLLAFYTISPMYAHAQDDAYDGVSPPLSLFVEKVKLAEEVTIGNESDFPGNEARASAMAPNLTPYHLSGWSGELVVSANQGDHSDDSPLYDTDTLYLDYAIANLGNISTYGQTFWIAIYANGVELIKNGPITTLSANHAKYFEDHPLRVSAGTYTLTLVVDSNDQIAELDETDNEFSRIITIEERGDGEIRFLSLTTDIGDTLRVGDQVTFIANAIGQGSIYYRFLYKAGYGTEAFNTPGGWIIAEDWGEDTFVNITFPNEDNYIVIVQASDTPNSWSAGDPQMGISVRVMSQ